MSTNVTCFCKQCLQRRAKQQSLNDSATSLEVKDTLIGLNKVSSPEILPDPHSNVSEIQRNESVSELDANVVQEGRVCATGPSLRLDPLQDPISNSSSSSSQNYLKPLSSILSGQNRDLIPLDAEKVPTPKDRPLPTQSQPSPLNESILLDDSSESWKASESNSDHFSDHYISDESIDDDNNDDEQDIDSIMNPPASKRRKSSESFPFISDGGNATVLPSSQPAQVLSSLHDDDASVDYGSDLEGNTDLDGKGRSIKKVVIVPLDSSLQSEWPLSQLQTRAKIGRSSIAIMDPRGGVQCLYLKQALPREALRKQIKAAETLRMTTHPNVWRTCAKGSHTGKRFITMGASRSYHDKFFTLRVTKQEQVSEFLKESEHVMFYVDRLLKKHFPYVHELYSALNQTKELPMAYATLQLNDGGSIFHRDRGDNRHGVCAVWCFGNDADGCTKTWQGGDLHLRELNVDIDLQPGDVVFFPGHSITHGNHPITSGQRLSCAAYLNQDFLSLAPGTETVSKNPKITERKATKRKRRGTETETSVIAKPRRGRPRANRPRQPDSLHPVRIFPSTKQHSESPIVSSHTGTVVAPLPAVCLPPPPMWPLWSQAYTSMTPWPNWMSYNTPQLQNFVNSSFT